MGLDLVEAITLNNAMIRRDMAKWKCSLSLSHWSVRGCPFFQEATLYAHSVTKLELHTRTGCLMYMVYRRSYNLKVFYLGMNTVT